MKDVERRWGKTTIIMGVPDGLVGPVFKHNIITFTSFKHVGAHRQSRLEFTVSLAAARCGDGLTWAGRMAAWRASSRRGTIGLGPNAWLASSLSLVVYG